MGNKSLAFKIIAFISIMIALILFSCIYSIYMINKTQEYAKETSTSWLPSINAFGEVNKFTGNLTRRVVSTIADSLSNFSDRLEKNTKDYNNYKESLQKLLIDYQKNGLISPGEESYYKETMGSYNILIKNVDEEINLVKAGKAKEAELHYNTNGREAIHKFIEDVEKESEFNIKGADESSKKGTSLTIITNWTMTLVILSSAIISLIIIFMILNITKAINESIISLKKQGTVTMNISKVLMESSQSLSESVTEQASSVHETTAAINEITSMVNKTSENAEQSTAVAKGASQKAENSQETMKKLVHSMETIQESNNQL